MNIFLPEHRRVVILGGSFNPAHQGHVHISKQIYNLLDIDAIYWLVTPHNPLKKVTELGDFNHRYQYAHYITKNIPYIIISDFEKLIASKYSWQTLSALKYQEQNTHMIWAIGSDNWSSFHKWQYWQDIIDNFPVVVYGREPDIVNICNSPAGIYARNRRAFNAERLTQPECWKKRYSSCYYMLEFPRHPLSATSIRQQGFAF